MESAIHNSMQVASKLLEKQAIISNNLANISTTGFKEKFNYLVRNETKNTKNLNNFSNTQEKEYYNFSAGTLNYTDRKLDLFIKENGWLAVKDANGQEAYTKNGHLMLNNQGKLTVQNHEVLGDYHSIYPSDNNLKISSHGIIKKIEKQANKFIESKIGSLKLVRLPNENLLQKENGLFYLKNLNKNSILHDDSIKIQSGMLETSNVNPTKNMIDMISNARQFEMEMKMISICDQNEEYANRLLDINN
ncbi:flagellar basal-body rod protein FlgF [Buchnera aphidicola (Muscaphis stroyani)]|uniref:Flagellar basal-body rod protein FlgF n=1 Tax=Buchnera aphidicola (Muscaphis stroyani) TaxID=1241869 RepID=A0A4D6Y4W4_9GAMM|nr:flagellar basal-body rod protein FlgF [Buchnera aphidicola]QCI24407.1 flagellar basal-body rod protein FlgF [Buchnera aphidicola (Muscaphis stroyani)]